MNDDKDSPKPEDSALKPANSEKMVQLAWKVQTFVTYTPGPALPNQKPLTIPELLQRVDERGHIERMLVLPVEVTADMLWDEEREYPDEHDDAAIDMFGR